MSEKSIGRKFKVGDKVKLTKAGEEADFFSPKFRKGDIAEIIELNSFDGSISRVVVTSGEAKGYPQLARNSTTWFKHVKAKKKHKKKRKHFRMGDFVKLKDSACLEECSIFGDITHSAIGVVCGMEYDGALIVHFTTKEGYNFDRVLPKALRLATKEERKTLRKHKVAKITYDNASENGRDIEVAKAKIPPEYDVKVGDIVEVTEYAGGYHVGTIGEVTLVKEAVDECYNRVKVRGKDGDCCHECNVRLVYQNHNGKAEDIIEPATEEEKMVMCDDEIVSHTGSVYHVHDIDTSIPPLTYCISVKKESSWFSDTELVNYYAKLLEDGRVYDWATDLTFANIETWVNSKNKV